MRLFLLLHRGAPRPRGRSMGADLVTSYLLKLADVVGVAPSLLVCASCGRVDDLHRFSFGGGGAICDLCRTDGAVRLRDGRDPGRPRPGRVRANARDRRDPRRRGDGRPPFRRVPPRSKAQLTGGDGVTLDLSGVDPERIPRHVGLILDGNGRWANARGLPRTAGHAAGEAALFDTVEGALEIGIEWLTAYTFSTENWTRSEEEVEFLMWFNEDLLTRRRDVSMPRCQDALCRGYGRPTDPGSESQAHGRGGRDDLRQQEPQSGVRLQLGAGARSWARPDPSPPAWRPGRWRRTDIDEETLARSLYIPDMPDVDLVIRSSGEHRLSNFLLWQAAYAEFHFPGSSGPISTGRPCSAQ